MHIDDFDYQLPPELIAQEPLPNRELSRLLVLHKDSGRIQHKHFTDLPAYLKPGDALVLNNTRVLPARLYGRRTQGTGLVEILLLHRKSARVWETLVRPGRKLSPGAEVIFGDGELICKIMDVKPDGERIVEFTYDGIFEEILDRLGEMPLPPYIKTKLADKERYQTVYAKEEGSAAAPTAGLHFTGRLLDEIKALGVKIVFITLHVGLGTFRPVQVSDITTHRMHSEYYVVPDDAAQVLNECRQNGGRIVAVGTTSCRTLETVTAENGMVQSKSGWTDIFIYPGHRFLAVDSLITNFHLPKSTLMMLISAFAGREKVFEAYQAAIHERYRFFSFGDAMLII